MSGLIIDRHERCATWTLNRPHVRNALDPSLIDAMSDALHQDEAADTEVIVLRGAGASFCAGADLKYLEAQGGVSGHTPRPFLSRIWDFTFGMEQSDIVFVSSLHGHAIAGGMELALASDVVIASRGALIGDGHVRNNLLPGGGASARMERAIGRGTAAWLALSGEFLVAEDPRLATWVQAVVPPAQLLDATNRVVEQLLSTPWPARAAYKRLLNARGGSATASDRDRELDAFDRHWAEHDVPSALRTFLSERRAS